MNASIQNSIFKTVYFILFALLISGFSSTTATAAETQSTHSVNTIYVSSQVNSSTSSDLNTIVIDNDDGMPLVREDVDLIRTAIVPGKAYVPATTPNTITSSTILRFTQHRISHNRSTVQTNTFPTSLLMSILDRLPNLIRLNSKSVPEQLIRKCKASYDQHRCNN